MDKKWRELDQAFQDSYYPPSENFLTSKASIEASEVFSILKIMPKGAALHTHDIAIASSDWVVDELTYW